ncbi:TIGR03085 family metal-binding protein [Ruania albidiflava]|uniref:TIGR03085 family metal-binding protein n=1 Tax=Ruania albidiflava TaxID=366586 RepID=UPI0003B60CE1|nr:TIGR03085 family metal-binding protein [Ruania albidiflava]
MWAQVEMQSLAETLHAAGPDRDTLCAGWRTRHLAAHLYLRAHQPWQLLGLVSGGGVAELAQQCQDPARYHELVDAFTGPVRGPWRLSRSRVLDDLTNLVEYVVHHEDVRRAGPDPAPPRSLPPEQRAQVWAKFARTALGFYLSAPVGVLLMVPGAPTFRARPGGDPVRVVGEPVEQALYAMGRRPQAQVELRGSTTQVEKLRRWAAGR